MTSLVLSIGKLRPALSEWLAAACLVALFAMAGHTCAAESAAPATPPQREIGIEGDVTVTLPNGDYQPRPLDDRTPLILRVGKIRPAADGRFTYEFHYIGFEPGTYKLSDYLVRPDGSLAEELGDELLHVRSMLPPGHDGSLNPYVPRPFPWFGGYRMFLAILALLWMAGIAAFAFFGRKKKAVMAPVIIAPPPTFAQRMRPLVEAAANGSLNAQGQAELERLMTGYWRDKLSLPDQRMADALTELKRHAEAGGLLRALERWLHRPGGATPVEVNDLLEPYRHPPAPAETQEASP